MSFKVKGLRAISRQVRGMGLSRAGTLRLLMKAYRDLPNVSDAIRRRRSKKDPDCFLTYDVLHDEAGAFKYVFLINDRLEEGALIIEGFYYERLP